MRKKSARVDFFACKHEINDLLNHGYSVTAIYTMLTDARRLNLSKTHFYRLVKDYCEQPEPLKQIPLPKDRLKNPSIIRKDGQKSRTSQYAQYGGRQDNSDNTTFRREQRKLEDLT